MTPGLGLMCLSAGGKPRGELPLKVFILKPRGLPNYLGSLIMAVLGHDARLIADVRETAPEMPTTSSTVMTSCNIIRRVGGEFWCRYT